MKATQFEFRFRLWIGFAIYVLGFWAPWLRYGAPVHVATTWLELSGELGRFLPLQTASVVVTSISLLLAAFGAIFRVWGTAYLGGPIVHSHTLHASDVVADRTVSTCPQSSLPGWLFVRGCDGNPHAAIRSRVRHWGKLCADAAADPARGDVSRRPARRRLPRLYEPSAATDSQRGGASAAVNSAAALAAGRGC